jgi:hypothetical protein
MVLLLEAKNWLAFVENLPPAPQAPQHKGNRLHSVKPCAFKFVLRHGSPFGGKGERQLQKILEPEL